jgi:hypothetical protein
LLLSRLNKVLIEKNLRDAFRAFKQLPPNINLIAKIVRTRESLDRASMRNAFDQIRRVSFSKSKQGG